MGRAAFLRLRPDSHVTSGPADEYVVSVSTVANSLGLAPDDVIRSMFSMQGARRISIELKHPGCCLRLLRHPSPAEWDELMDGLVRKMHTLERSQLAKLEQFGTAMRDALAAKPRLDSVTGETGTTAALFRGMMIRPLAGTSSPASDSVPVGGCLWVGGCPELVSDAMDRTIRRHIDSYFIADAADYPPIEPPVIDVADVTQQVMRRDIASFASSLIGRSGRQLDSGRAVARILHGIGSPRYPTRDWRDHPMWRRYEPTQLHLAEDTTHTGAVRPPSSPPAACLGAYLGHRRYIQTDFHLIRSIATEELIRLRT